MGTESTEDDLALLRRLYEKAGGDPSDIEHLATLLPYVDILIVDRFMAGFCNQNHIRLGENYGCEIRRLRRSEIASFIEEIDALVKSSPHSTLANRIAKAIDEGGFHQEFAERTAAYLRARGIDPDKGRS